MKPKESPWNVLFSHIIFQPESDIKIFIDKFYEVLKKRSNYGSKLAELGFNIYEDLQKTKHWKEWEKDTPARDCEFKVGWLTSDEVYQEIGAYLEQLTNLTDYKYDGKKFIDLVRAIRNLNVHDVLENRAVDPNLIALGKKCAEKLRDQPYYFWIKQFPDLIFQLYAAGLNRNIPGWKSNADLVDYINRFYANSTKFERNIFSTANQFAKCVAKLILLDSQTITERLMQAISCNGIQIRILKNPNEHPKLRNTSQSGERVLINFSIEEEQISKFILQRKQRNGSLIGQPLELGIRHNGETPVQWKEKWEPIVIFTKDVRAAVNAIEKDESLYNKPNTEFKVLIYTTKEFCRIRDTFDDSFIASSTSFTRQELKWLPVEDTEANGSTKPPFVADNLRSRLLSTEFNLFLNSPTKITLETAFLDPISQPKTQPSSSKNSIMINDPYGTIIPGLIHGNDLICSNIHNEPEKYFARWLQNCKTRERILDDEFVKKNLPGKGNISIIKGVLGMGKSTLLVKLGDDFIKNGWISTYCTAHDVMNEWEKRKDTVKANKKDELKIRCFFPHFSNFEWKILYNLSKNPIGYRFIVLLDGLEEVSRNRIEKCLDLIQENFNKEQIKAPLQFIIASQPAQVDFLVSKFKNATLYDIESFNFHKEAEYLLWKWRIYAKTKDNEKQIQNAVRSLLLYDKSLPEIQGTPLASVLRSKMYIEFAQNLSIFSSKNVHGFCETLEQLIEFRLKTHLRKFFTSRGSSYSMKDYSSWFLEIPKAVLKSICEERAIKMLFPKDTISLPNYYPFEIPEFANIDEFGLLEGVNSFIIEKMEEFFSAGLFFKSIKRPDSNLVGVLDFFFKKVLSRANEGYIHLEKSKQEPDAEHKVCMKILHALNSLIKKNEVMPLEILGTKMQKLTDYEVFCQSLILLFQNSNFKLFEIFVEALQYANWKVKVEEKCLEISNIQFTKHHDDTFLEYIGDGNLIVTKFLLRNFKMNPNLIQDNTGVTPLHTAVAIDDAKLRVSMVELLKENLADIRMTNYSDDKTPFEEACKNACETTLQILLRKYNNTEFTKDEKDKFMLSVKQAKHLKPNEKSIIKHLIYNLNTSAIYNSGNSHTV